MWPALDLPLDLCLDRRARVEAALVRRSSFVGLHSFFLSIFALPWRLPDSTFVIPSSEDLARCWLLTFGYPLARGSPRVPVS